MALCSISIFIAVPIGRSIQRYVYKNWGRDLFIHFVLGVLAITFLGLLYFLILKLKVRTLSNYIWLFVISALYLYFTMKLRNIPEEAVHFLEYGLLGFFLFKALSHHVKDKSIYLSATLFALLIGTFDEILQWITPQRYWDFRDAGLNGLSGGLFQLAVWKVLQPKIISGKVTAHSIKIFSLILSLCLIVFGLCASNTPPRVAYYIKIFPWLSFLQKEEPMSEFGYKYKDEEIGVFYSRLSLNELRKNDEENANLYAKILNESCSIPYEQFIRDYNPINNPFLHEIRIHIFRRDTHFDKAKVATNPDEKKESYFIAYKENIILEKYFSKSINKSIYRWNQEKTEEIGSLIEKNEFYESPVSAGLFTTFSEKTMWISILITLLMVVLFNFYYYRKKRIGQMLIKNQVLRNMHKAENKKIHVIFIILSFFYLAIFCFFYYKYVPLIKSFQVALAPVLFFMLVITSIKIEWGILFFVFAFPLINNLPYFFGIYGHIPHAPTALILFLVFFLGWLVNKSFANLKLSFNHPVFRPLFLLSLIIFISGIITFFRYTNFWPFLSPKVYELTVNVNMVSAGGAIMSDVFSSLNYITGFLFFVILFNNIKSKAFLKKLFIALSISTLIFLLFSLFQKYHSLNLGNMPFWVNANQINSTFKDPNSFGACLSAFLPLLLGMFFFASKYLKLFFLFIMILALFIFPSIGSRSPVLGLIISMAIFFLLLMLNMKGGFKKKVIFGVSFFLIIIIVIVSISFLSKDSNLSKRLGWSLERLSDKDSLNGIFTGKINQWTISYNMIKEYPLAGVGLGAFIVELPNYGKIMGFPYGATDSAENYFFQAGSELGIIGLFLVFWLFVAILKQMRRSWKEVPSDNKYKLILIGAISGLVSLFINYLFHSYIGSYEVKYTFWLLVGVIFCMGRMAEARSTGEQEKAPEPKLRWSKGLKMASITLIILFGAVHLWNSTHSLSLKSRTEQFNLKQDFGFYELEKTNDGREFRWTRGYGGLTLKIEKPVMAIPLLAFHPDIHQKPVKVKVYLVKDFFKEKKLLGEITLTRSAWETHEFHIPEELGQEVILLFKVSRTWNPLKVHGTPDPRNLGVAVGKIEFEDKPGL